MAAKTKTAYTVMLTINLRLNRVGIRSLTLNRPLDLMDALYRPPEVVIDYFGDPRPMPFLMVIFCDYIWPLKYL